MSGGLFGTLPVTASELAGRWDALYYFMFALCTFFFVIVIGPMLVFMVKYRARPGRRAADIRHHLPLEIVWTAIPTVVVMGVFLWGWLVFKDMRTPPSNAMEVRAVAFSWGYNFQYDDGRTTSNELVVPVNQVVKVLVTSKNTDVIHGFYVPNLRVKHDMVPGFYAPVWFRANTIGRHMIYCHHYCGTGHSQMVARLVVLSDEDYKKWKWGKEDIDLPPWIGPGGISNGAPFITAGLNSLTENAPVEKLPPQSAKAGDGDQSMVDQGKMLLEKKACITCHSVDGSPSNGPSFYGVWSSEAKLSDGSQVIVDENYFSESVRKPNAKIAAGYEKAGAMPSYLGQITTEELNAMMAYIKTLRK